jgi:hypothetical protein
LYRKRTGNLSNQSECIIKCKGGRKMEKRCYECGSKEIEKATIAPDQKGYLTLFAQAVAEVEICEKCGTVIAITGEHPSYKNQQMD